tara:strand:- start:159 stop:335 length:177 start_codon:yes stop_codon:yes gene_type:complete
MTVNRLIVESSDGVDRVSIEIDGEPIGAILVRTGDALIDVYVDQFVSAELRRRELAAD